MRRRLTAVVLISAILANLGPIGARGGDWPFRQKADPAGPNTMAQVARSLDEIEDKIRDDGVVTIKQPDVWSQNSMTKYRKDFEQQMRAELTTYQTLLSARVARSDQATFNNQTALSAALPAAAAASPGRGRNRAVPGQSGAASAVNTPTVIAMPASSGSSKDGSGSTPPPASSLLGASDNSDPFTAPFSLIGGKAFKNIGQSNGQLGLEPNVFLDEKKSYLDHLNGLRQINLGSDNADAAGYGLYLIHMPVSIQPGECTVKGHGASMTVTAKHYFTKRFLEETFRMMVINDLLDALTPVVYEMLRSGYIDSRNQVDTDQNYLKNKRILRKRELDVLKTELDAIREKKRNSQNQLTSMFRKSIPTIVQFFQALAAIINLSEKEIKNANSEDNKQDKTLYENYAAILAAVLEPAIQDSTPEVKELRQAILNIAQKMSTGSNSIQQDFAKFRELTGLTPNDNSMDKPPAKLRQITELVQQGLQFQLTREDQTNELVATLSRLTSKFTARSRTIDEVARKYLFIKVFEYKNPTGRNEAVAELQRKLNERESLIKLLDDIKTSWSFLNTIDQDGNTFLQAKIDLAIHTLDRLFGPAAAELQPLKNQLSGMQHYLLAITAFPKTDSTFTPIGTNKNTTDKERLSNKKYLSDLSGLETAVKSYVPSNAAVTTQDLILDQKIQEQAKDLVGLIPVSLLDERSNDSAISKTFNETASLKPLQEVLASLSDINELQTNLIKNYASVEASITDAISKTTGDDSRDSKAFDKQIATFLPLSQSGGGFYPLALTEFDDVFLISNFETIARSAKDALPTKTPRFTDIRAFLKRELESSYWLMKYYESYIETIHKNVRERDYESLKKVDFPTLVAALPGELRGRSDDILTALCWTIAVDAGLLNEQICYHIKTAQESGKLTTGDPSDMIFYWHEYEDAAEEPQIFSNAIQYFWPILTFAVDPVVDQQNIADATSLRRDLQLALAFSFTSGKLSFSQLDKYTRKVEFDAETIALNRTISSFTQGKATFGWRFYPRYQNPPPEKSNFQTFSNLVLRNGPGREYQSRNSKLEPGQRDLTAVVVMPSFVPMVKFETTGNWFWLHDPEQLTVPTARMLHQGERVMELQEDLTKAHECGRVRAGDYERIKTRIDQVEEILPMQTYEVKVPYTENSGFDLFTNISGQQALVPLILGFDGADFIDPSKQTDLILYGKRFSILESQVVVGGKYLMRDNDAEKTGMEIISREAMRIIIPAETQPTVDVAGKKYVEVVVATPGGISNRKLIPYGPPSEPPKTNPTPVSGEVGYTLKDNLIRVGADVTPADPQANAAGAQSGAATLQIQTTNSLQISQGGQAGGSGQLAGGAGSQKLTVKAGPVAQGSQIRITPAKPPANATDTITADFRFPVGTDTVISVSVPNIPYVGTDYLIDESLLSEEFAADLIAKLDGYGKLTGQSPIHDLATRHILISVDGSPGEAKFTSNQLLVSIELYVQKKAAAKAAVSATKTNATSPAASSAATTQMSASAAKTKAMSSTDSSKSGAVDAADLDPSVGRTGLPPMPPTAKSSAPAPARGRSGPASPPLGREPATSKRGKPTTKASQPPASRPGSMPELPPLPGESAPSQPAPAQPAVAQPASKSFFSRITGKP